VIFRISSNTYQKFCFSRNQWTLWLSGKLSLHFWFEIRLISLHLHRFSRTLKENAENFSGSKEVWQNGENVGTKTWINSVSNKYFRLQRERTTRKLCQSFQQFINIYACVCRYIKSRLDYHDAYMGNIQQICLPTGTNAWTSTINKARRIRITCKKYT